MKPTINVDQLDSGATVVNFDLWDTDHDEPAKQGGYVQVEHGESGYTVDIFNSDGDVLSSTFVPFDFKD